MNLSTSISIENIIDSYPIKKEYIENDSIKEKYINNYEIFVINLDTDKLRREYIKILMKKMNINYFLLTVKHISKELYKELQINKIMNNDVNIGELGCCLSHLWCLKNAITNNIQNFIVFEDDIVFHKKFHQLFEETLKMDSYDLLMLGACDFNIGYNIQTYNILNGTYTPIKNALGAHANFYSLKFAKTFFDEKISNFSSYDSNYIKFYSDLTYNIKICYQNLVVCELSSTNLNHNFSFNNLFKENYYYKNCFATKFDYSDYYFIYLELFRPVIENKIILSNLHNYKDLINKLSKNYSEMMALKLRSRVCYDFFNLENIEELIRNYNISL
jgi:GR25 family glycosyltransferase involved in LPS biosynthesis